MVSSNIIGTYTSVQYTYILYSIKLKKYLYLVSIDKINFYNSILKVFLILFYSNTSISILILFQKYFLQDCLLATQRETIVLIHISDC